MSMSLAISGSNIFAGTSDGVFLSSNNGSCWAAVNTGLTNTNVNSLAISGNNIFAGTRWWCVFVFKQWKLLGYGEYRFNKY